MTVRYMKKEPALDALQKAVGGYIAAVRLRDGRTMYVDEDGIAKGLTLNREASDLAGIPLFGTAVVIGGGDE